MQPTLIICEDDPLYGRALSLALGSSFAVCWLRDRAALLAALAQAPPALVLLDLHLAAHDDGFLALQALRQDWPQVRVVVHSGRSDTGSVVQAMRLGARDYLPKGCSMASLRQSLLQAVAPAVVASAVASEMVGSSAALEGLRAILHTIARYPGNVIILGESGVGKELVARALQQPQMPFVPVDAATLQQATAESQLFGHERGAFTGAERRHRGLLEAAHGGILYIDEIANLSMDVQAKLLRAVQEQEIVRLGGSERIRLRFRVVCASHEDLTQLCQQGRFRFDLLMRLAVFTLEVPPLRQRPEDIAVLVTHLLARPGAGAGIEEAALASLMGYAWPGNVRELANALQFAIAMADGRRIERQHLPPRLTAPPPAAGLPPAPTTAPSLRARISAFERRILTEGYVLAAGNVSRLARQLQMDRSHLHAKLRAYAIPRP